MKQANSLALNSAEQAVLDKVTNGAAAKEQAWVNAQVITTTPEELAEIKRTARAQLDPKYEIDLMSYESKVTAPGADVFSTEETAANNALQELIDAEGAKWVAGTFVAAEQDGSFAMAAAGAFVALAALF